MYSQGKFVRTLFLHYVPCSSECFGQGNVIFSNELHGMHGDQTITSR